MPTFVKRKLTSSAPVLLTIASSHSLARSTSSKPKGVQLVQVEMVGLEPPQRLLQYLRRCLGILKD
jgi:hypothetical protein